MNEVQRKVLRSLHGDILKNLILDTDILGYFLQKDILTESMVQSIQSKTSQHEKIIEMLFMLPKRSPKAFPMFIEAVKKHSPHLSDKLEHEYEKEIKLSKWAEKVSEKAQQQKPPIVNPEEVALEENLQPDHPITQVKPVSDTPDNLADADRTPEKTAHKPAGVPKARSMSISSTNHVMTSSIMQQNLNNLYIRMKAKLETKNIRDQSFCSPEPATFKALDKLLDDLFHVIDEQETIFSQCHALLGGKDRNYPLVSHIINLQRSKRDLEQDLKQKEQQKNKYGDHISKLENRCRNQATEISHLTSEIKKMKEEIEQLQSINSEKDEKQKIIDELRKMVMEADTSKKSKLRSSYLALHYDGNVTEIKQLRTEIRNLRADNENLKTENLMLKKSENLKKLVKLREDGNPRHEELPSAGSYSSDDRGASRARSRPMYPVQVGYQKVGQSAKSADNDRGYFTTNNNPSRTFMRASAEQLTNHESEEMSKQAKAKDKDGSKDLDFKFSQQNGSLGQKRGTSKDRTNKRVKFYGDDDDDTNTDSKDKVVIHTQAADYDPTVSHEITPILNGQNQSTASTAGKVVSGPKIEKQIRGRQPKIKQHITAKANSRRSASLNSITSNRDIMKMSSHLIQKSRNLRQPVGH